MTNGDPAAVAAAEMDRFLLLAIHDLRAPLRQSLLRAQLLERSTAGTMNSASEAHLLGLIEANRCANSLLTRLAEYCQSGCGRDRLPPVGADILVQNAIRTVNADPNATIVADGLSACIIPAALQKVFFEILDNAWKFRRGALTVHIRARRAESECVFEIQDNGVGFEPRYAETIWEPLQRLHGIGDYPGFGLGLAISRRIVAGLKGRTWAASEAGEGSTFYFSVPSVGGSMGSVPE